MIALNYHLKVPVTSLLNKCMLNKLSNSQLRLIFV